MRTQVTLCGWKGLQALVAAFLVLCSTALASGTFEPTFRPSLEISKTKASIDIDGKLNDAGWVGAVRAGNFAERSPGDKVKPAVETEVFITYDDDKLYVGFVCHDDPATIRSTMCQRDQYSGNDEVGLLIDAYGNASWAYEFFTNALGVQKDRLWSSIVGEDPGFDLTWESAAQITDSGYQVEMAIPFTSMRFPNKDVQTWKMEFWRNRPRDSYYQYSWGAHDRNEQCWVCEWGTVTGIADVRPGRGLEILPSIVANQSGQLSDISNPDSDFDNTDPDGDVSIGAKYALTSDVTMEAAYNPDFSQIEADAAQIDVNTRIALFYPERRPFFQEGSDIFRTLFNSFYTRTVNDPQYAAKMTGRLDGMSVGFLSALDQNSPYMIPLDEASALLNTGKSYVNVLRANRNVGDDSQIGFIVNDRRMEGGGSNTVMAFDHDIRLSRLYSWDGQYIFTHTAEPDNLSMTEGLEGIEFSDGDHTAVFDGESYYGTAFITRLRRSSRAWNFILDYNQVSPSYRTETGYDPLVNYRNASVTSWYTFYFDKGLLQRLTPQAYVGSRWSFQGLERFRNFGAAIDGQLRFAQTHFALSGNGGRESYGGVQFDNLWQVGVDFGSILGDRIAYDINISRGVGIARGWMAKGDETSVYAALDLKPVDRLTIEPSLNYARSTHHETGEKLYDGYITRTRLQYQANKELSVRLVVQYNDFYESWDVDPLITYRLSSFSVFYIGSTHDYCNLSCPTPDEESKWALTSRQFFMKLQYLFQI